MYTIISSNHLSLADQAQDALFWLGQYDADHHEAIAEQFPVLFDQWRKAEAHADLKEILDSPNYDPETLLWLVDAIENESPIRWREGEPFICEVSMIGGVNYAPGPTEFFASVTEACETWVARLDSNGATKVDGVLFPGWGDGMDIDDPAIISPLDETLTVAQVVTVAHYPHHFGHLYLED